MGSLHAIVYCGLTQAQAWIDLNRKDPVFGPLVRDQEGYLIGTPPSSTRAQYLKVLKSVDRMIPDAMTPTRGSVPEIILHAIHEYLIRPEFRSYRDPFVAKRMAQYKNLLSTLKETVIKVIPDSPLAQALTHSIPIYNFNNIAIFDNSYSGYWKVLEPFPVPYFKNFDAEQFNQAQNLFRIETKTQDSWLFFYVTTRSNKHTWIFRFSR